MAGPPGAHAAGAPLDAVVVSPSEGSGAAAATTGYFGSAGEAPPHPASSVPARHTHAPQFASPLRSAYQPSPSPPSSSASSLAPSTAARSAIHRTTSYDPPRESLDASAAAGARSDASSAARRLSEPHPNASQPGVRTTPFADAWHTPERSMTPGLDAGSVPRRSLSRAGSANGMDGAGDAYGLPQYTTPGGYASSVDGDFYSAPPSRLISRTPTPVHGLGSVAAVSESEEYASSDSSESFGRPASAAGGLGAFFGWGTRGAGMGRASSKGSYHALSRHSVKSSGDVGKWDGMPSTPLMEAGASKKGRWAARARGVGSPDDRLADRHLGGGGDLPLRTRIGNGRRRKAARGGWPNPLRLVSTLLGRTFRTFFGPIHPATIMVALALIAAFVTSVTMLIIYILNPDKEPLPWRTYCAAQMPFPHIFADRLAPVDVLVGVLTVDNKYERRNMIRSTYASHTLPLGPDGRPMANVQVKFILGKVRKAHARRVALEMEAYNDIVVLDMDENMSARKTLTFLKWAAQNATMPFVRPSAPLSAAPSTPDHADAAAQLPDKAHRSNNVAWKKVDYVVKADDDSFIVLSELERHLRVAPRKLTYWGYLVKEWFMGGEAYALSMDLVEWLAHSPEVERTAKGKEDTRTPQWIAMHPNRSSVSWVSEHCWIYDHPKAGTPYSHGFLFPDYVERIKAEARVGLSEQEVAWRGGERRSHSYSTVSRWHHAYVAPRDDLTAEEEIEALVEGGGRWAGTWVRGSAAEGSSSETEAWLPWSDIVYESDDERLRVSADSRAGGQGIFASDVSIDQLTGLPQLGPPLGTNSSNATGAPAPRRRRVAQVAPPPSLERDQVPPAVQHRDPGWLTGSPSAAPAIDGDERLEESAGGIFNHLPILPDLAKLGRALQVEAAPLAPNAAEQAAQRAMAADREAEKLRLLPRPTHKDGDGTAAELRARRYLGRPHGGTVVVHYLKKSEWWLETAMIFLGRSAMWQSNIGGAAREYRQYGSPLVRHDGYISEGRSQPRPDQGFNVAEGDERWSAIAGKKQRPPAGKPSTQSSSSA